MSDYDKVIMLNFLVGILTLVIAFQQLKIHRLERRNKNDSASGDDKPI